MKTSWWWVLLIIGVLGCDSENPASGGAGSDEYSALEKAVFDSVNSFREDSGKIPLAWSNEILPHCREHSSNMAKGIVPYGHDGFDNRVSLINQTMNKSAFGENVGFTSNTGDPGPDIINGWITSDIHRAIMLGDYDLAAIGAAADSLGHYYFTKILVK